MTRNDLLTLDGITQPITEWALDYGIPAAKIMARLKQGMTIEKAVTTPIRAKPGVTLDEIDPTWDRGVAHDLATSSGTGGGSATRDRAEIEFSENGESR
jgi:hypothetical protein